MCLRLLGECGRGVRRAQLDRCLPQILLAENRFRRTNHLIPICFFVLCVALFVILGGRVRSLASVYAYLPLPIPSPSPFSLSLLPLPLPFPLPFPLRLSPPPPPPPLLLARAFSFSFSLSIPLTLPLNLYLFPARCVVHTLSFSPRAVSSFTMIILPLARGQ
jgi:hypothetical protein